jgi:predicted membrane-bound mannosyltransferase
MNCIRICILACVLPLAMASLAAFAGAQGLAHVVEQPAAHDPHRDVLQALVSASARSHRTHHVSKRRAPHAKVQKNDRHDDLPLVQVAQRPASERKPDHVAAIATQKADAHDAAERYARAERLYRGSQVSAPIVKDAKACKRIGAHGESIFENC